MSSEALRVRHRRHGRGQASGAKQGSLYRSGYALVANTAGTTVVGVIYWAVAAHVYDRQALGRSSALVAALILVSSFAQLNMTNTLPRFIPKAGGSAGKFIATSYGVSSVAALIGGLAFVVVLPRVSSQWHFVSSSVLLSVTFVASAVVWGIFALQDVALLGLQRPILVPVENFVYGVCKLLLLVGVAWALPLTGIFISWVIPLAITVPAVNWLIFRRYLKDRRPPPESKGFSRREVIRFASVDYVGTVLAQASGNLLPLLVLSTLGAAANGSFYIAWSIASGLGLVALNFGTSLLVEGATAPHRLAELTRGVIARCVTITSAGAVVLILAARPILEIYGSGYAIHATALLGMLALGTIPNCLVVVAVSLDRIAGHVGRATLTRLALTVLVLGTSGLLLRKVGIYGVAWAWGGANLVVALIRLPTILGVARRRATPEQVADLGRRPRMPRPRVQTRSQRLAPYRHPASGRHRAGAPRAHRVERTGHIAHSLTPPVFDAPQPGAARQESAQTADALQLLMSLGKWQP